MNNSNEFDLSELQRLALEELSAANVLGGSQRKKPRRSQKDATYRQRAKEAQARYENFKRNIDVEDADKRFVFHIYQVCSDTFPDMEAAHLTRLIYLATFLNYDNNIVTPNGKPMNKAMVQKQLMLKDPQFYRFWNDMVKKKILLVGETAISLNESIFFRGSTASIKKRCGQNGTTFTRLYIHGIRELYEKSTTSSHKTLSYMFRILPYVSHKFNVVCSNPYETNSELVQPMSAQEIAEAIGYEKHNISALMRKLINTTFIVDGKEMGALGIVSSYLAAGNKSEMFINPKVYYAGDAHDEVRILKIFFKAR